MDIESSRLWDQVVHGREVEVRLIDADGEVAATEHPTMDDYVPAEEPMLSITFTNVSGPTRWLESIEWESEDGTEGVIFPNDGLLPSVTGGGVNTTVEMPVRFHIPPEGE